VLAVVLGGGRGTRLWPLTRLRAKPAVPIAGKYRLIDIPLSNCLNSGIYQIAILTQFNSVSLHRHIAQTYNFDAFHSGWVQILAAEQTFDTNDWYQGTADAVRKQLFEIEATGARQVLILAGDHLYRMDYAAMVQSHIERRADISLAVKPIAARDAPRFGVLKLDGQQRCVAFVEKPKEPAVWNEFKSPTADAERPLLGSMGIYLFDVEVLTRLLREFRYDDFGSDLLPEAVKSLHVHGHEFDGYWEDVGTIRSFYEANLALAHPETPFDFHDPVRPIYTRPRFLPCSRVVDVRLDTVLVADGCVIEGAEITQSVIGVRSAIGRGAMVRDTVMMGADYYEGERGSRGDGVPPIGIGPRSRVRGAILDKNARIGADVVIEPFPRGTDLDQESYCVRDGIVVVAKGAMIADGARVGPNA
jgi:glucose-1-phosphate adenylyltransferase